jgi:hypothetical protein
MMLINTRLKLWPEPVHRPIGAMDHLASTDSSDQVSLPIHQVVSQALSLPMLRQHPCTYRLLLRELWEHL